MLTGPSDDHDHEDEESADAEGDKLDDLPPPLLGKFKILFNLKIAPSREKRTKGGPRIARIRLLQWLKQIYFNVKFILPPILSFVVQQHSCQK